MDDARELILQDVRCFHDEQRGRLRPITLLVGENSTGKTTFLGCYRMLHRMFSGPRIGEFSDFNEEPFAIDPRVLALARAAGVRLLYTADGDLISDFKDKSFTDRPRGKVYSGAHNAELLTGSVCAPPGPDPVR